MNRIIFAFLALSIVFVSPVFGQAAATPVAHNFTVTMPHVNTLTLGGTAPAVTLPTTPAGAYNTEATGQDTASTIAYSHNHVKAQKIQVSSDVGVLGDNWKYVHVRVKSAGTWGTIVGAEGWIELLGAAEDATRTSVAATDFLTAIVAGNYAPMALTYQVYHKWGADASAKVLTVTYTTKNNDNSPY